jgi:hypothetical protein
MANEWTKVDETTLMGGGLKEAVKITIEVLKDGYYETQFKNLEESDLMESNQDLLDGVREFFTIL